MEDFNAAKAKAISDSLSADEVSNILIDIKSEAEKGKDICYFNKYISTKSRLLLKKRGFNVFNFSSISIQKEGLYHSISWA